jgi:hypothetical protein
MFLKSGNRLSRVGWNGPNQWVCLMPSLQLPPNNSPESGPRVNDRTAKFIGVGTALDSQPYFALMNAQGKWQPGWVPSISDILAEDWVLLPDNKEATNE